VIFNETPIGGVWLIDIEPHEDERGFFARTFCEAEMAAHGIALHVSQCNTSWCRVRGTLRGLHYQAEPHPDAKIVRCTRGALWDVAVDLRAGSPTYKKWTGVELTADNRRMVYIPPGLAHGFITLADDTEVCYQMGAPYVAEASRTARWDDPAFSIAWPIEPTVMAPRDRECPPWRD
jgi:dTDP-4-dehydrorhamnose 3,5-epimerase